MELGVMQIVDAETLFEMPVGTFFADLEEMSMPVLEITGHSVDDIKVKPLLQIGPLRSF
jgi:hypothetical protein